MQQAQYSLTELNDFALQIRRSIIRMLEESGSGHSAGALGMTDVFTSLYFALAKQDPQNPSWPDRDYILVSNGHICPVWYATLAQAGYFPQEELLKLRKIDTRLQGHPHRGSLPGVENTSGPLGQGLSQACGLAYALKMDNKPNRVYCVVSDGEQDEGQTWEAYLFAAKNGLDNLTLFIDRNHIQIDGYTEHIMPLESLRNKLESFNWNVLEVDGHNIELVIDAVHQAQATHEQPTVLICHTTPGKGVDFMENQYSWHGKPPDHEQAQAALKQLRSLCGQYWCE